MIVYYHNACPDGWCAAWVAKRKYPDAKLVALDHGLTLEQLDSIYREARGQDVLMVDYSLRTREANDELARVANSFRILDHHKSAKEVLAGAPYATFDMNRSGAGLAWDHLFGVVCKERPFQVPDEPGQVGYFFDAPAPGSSTTSKPAICGAGTAYPTREKFARISVASRSQSKRTTRSLTSV